MACVQPKRTSDIYLFSYFKGNGEDGLHMAWSRDGLHWKSLKGDSSFLHPEVSEDQLMRDPCIIRGADSLFHMVWTDSWTDKGIGYASSPDLLHWSRQQRLPVMEQEEGARNCWAPEITCDPSSRTCMIYWATTITGRYSASDEIAEDRYNHRIYYVTTEDFLTFSSTKLLFDPGFNCIDATIVPDKQGFIMFFKDERLHPEQKNIKMARSAELTGPYQLTSNTPVTGDYWAEGPTTIHTGDKWILYFDRYQDQQFGAITSTDLKTWTDISGRIRLPEGIRHGSILKITEQELERLTDAGRQAL
jgi:hypothetical protein